MHIALHKLILINAFAKEGNALPKSHLAHSRSLVLFSFFFFGGGEGVIRETVGHHLSKPVVSNIVIVFKRICDRKWGFHKWGYPKWMVYEGKTPLTWMI